MIGLLIYSKFIVFGYYLVGKILIIEKLFLILFYIWKYRFFYLLLNEDVL